MTSPSQIHTRLRRVVLSIAAGLLLLPAGAGAATATSDGATASVRGTDAAESVDVQYYEGQILLRGSVEAGPGCIKQEAGGDVVCPGGTGGVIVSLAGGDDHVSSYLSDAPAGRYGRFDLGSGSDVFEGYGSEVVQGGTGDDEISGLTGDDELDGGEGNDKVDGSVGADTVRGGAGNDVLKGDPMESRSADVIDGGPGRDSITDWMHEEDPSIAPTPTVTLDGAADDGFPGEGDNVTNMEIVESYGGLRFVGTGSDDIAPASEVGARGDLRGLAGNDQLRGTDRDDAIDGGPGDDDLQGGFGNDTIVGGPGRDRIVADRDGRCNEMHCDLSPGASSDTIDARDGEADTISCGPGQDTVQVDAADTVAPDCETVVRAGTGTTPDGTPAPAGGASGVVIALAGRASLRALLRGDLAVKVSGRAPEASVTVRVLRGRTLVARGGGRADTHGTARVRVLPTRSGRTALRNRRSARLKIVTGAQTRTVAFAR